MSSFLISFSVWADKLKIDTSLLPMANNLPTFYDINGNLMDYKSDNFLHPEEIPDNLKNAFIALEDKRFYEHEGFDTYRMAGAMAKNIARGGVVEGASTITQQLIKNTHLTFEKTMSRKLKEIALAQRLEYMYSKDEILSMYLSVIYFGNGAYGVKSA
ncbi:MAG: transglycosylase domain-containing protein, partial [Clostridia bacterium]|nr:transglycosylase domain-containing protein [Clostridia bacterium]